MKKIKDAHITIEPVEQGILTFCILGDRPLVCNRMSEKAKRELLLPKGRKRLVDRTGLKHNPLEEYRASPYVNKDPKAPTFLQACCSWFKGAMKQAALDLPGIAKTQVERLIWVEGERVDLYGVPKLQMVTARMPDFNHTPDIRTRAILPQWACQISVSYTKPMMRETPVVNLLANAGFMSGVGDHRAGKGSATFGRFVIVNANDPRFEEVLKIGDRKTQEAAMEVPEFYDDETAELYEWFQVEVKRRGFEAA